MRFWRITDQNTGLFDIMDFMFYGWKTQLSYETKKYSTDQCDQQTNRPNSQWDIVVKQHWINKLLVRWYPGVWVTSVWQKYPHIIYQSMCNFTVEYSEKTISILLKHGKKKKRTQWGWCSGTSPLTTWVVATPIIREEVHHGSDMLAFCIRWRKP